MFENIENLKITSALLRVSKRESKIMGRGTNGFNIRVSGEVTYYFPDETVSLKAGDMVFIPKGYIYSLKTTEDSVCSTINFDGDFSGTKPFWCSLKDFAELDFFESRFHDLWKFGSLGDKCECISKFYSLLSFVSNVNGTKYTEKKKYELLEPAVKYLKDNIFNINLKAEKLHLLCGISNTYFRELFFLRFKTTPKEYIISKRVSHAKSIIDCGDFMSVKELAFSVGYKDALYFGKVFKKAYGVSPSEFNK